MTDPTSSLDSTAAETGSERYKKTSFFETSTFKASTEIRPNGDLMLIVESPQYGVYRRIVPKDLKDSAALVSRIKLDLMILHGELPPTDILLAAHRNAIPSYTLGKLHKTRYASLWEDRKINKEDPLG
tara:strand:- start:578 stop:961 length:384 start_codon:yes stop_codon:yes gene_type:complete